jgi:hypothetical protein
MSIDTQLRTRLTSAVEDTTVPPGLARGAVAGGRRRRRRRAVAGGLALATVTVVATAVAQLPGSPLGREGEVAAGASADLADGLAWARSLPQGDDPALPFFGEGGLWSDGQMYDTLGEEVNYGYPPREVEGGWLVVTGQDVERLGFAVMSSDGTLRPLPAEASVRGFGDERVAVSADGRRVAHGSWVVDLTTMQATLLPHLPQSTSQQGYATESGVLGFTDDGLVYEGAPFEQGMGSTWLLRDDGTTTEVEPPQDSHISQGDPADVSVHYDYVAGDTDTCMTTYVLRDASWEEWRSACMGQALGEALAVSPRAEWLLTDDLPRVWSIADGRWDRLDMPVGLGRAQVDAQRGGAVWESDDTFLLPFADRWTGATSPEPEFVQHVQVVRCSLSTLSCERAGDEQYLPVASTMWSSGQVRFAQH